MIKSSLTLALFNWKILRVMWHLATSSPLYFSLPMILFIFLKIPLILNWCVCMKTWLLVPAEASRESRSVTGGELSCLCAGSSQRIANVLNCWPTSLSSRKQHVTGKEHCSHWITTCISGPTSKRANSQHTGLSTRGSGHFPWDYVRDHCGWPVMAACLTQVRGQTDWPQESDLCQCTRISQCAGQWRHKASGVGMGGITRCGNWSWKQITNTEHLGFTRALGEGGERKQCSNYTMPIPTTYSWLLREL